MQWTGLNELREKFLSFFETKAHLRLQSYSLIPQGDKSLLLINSGMAPMKKYFTGEVTPPQKRVVTCQKCIRTPDIERVGITARHGTFFEMLGNFSFGDYFKSEATAWAWEFFTKELQIPAQLLYCSIYEEDAETRDIWINQIGVDPSHIVPLGKEDNFWEHGSGPCGPCSEIYFDRGEKYGCGSPTCGVGCECDRYIEVWNLVFTQLDSDGKGNYSPLENPNIDTGMGLERLACVLQGVDNLFLVDTMQSIMKHVSAISGVTYGKDEKSDISLRVITDHIRSTVFMIGDGVMPSNEGRGYVLRRLLRRAARHGRLLGVLKPFLTDLAGTVIAENRTAYPELSGKAEMIRKLIHFEEESFYKTIDQGFALLNRFIENADNQVFSGDDAFKLNDTFGFPLDLTKEILSEKGMAVDEARFQELLLRQRQQAKAARKNAGADAWKGDGKLLEGVPATVFIGYEHLMGDAKILAVLKDGERVERCEPEDEVVLVLDQTPFYAESGGQVGDSGLLGGKGFTADIITTTKNPSGVYLHQAVIRAGVLTQGAVASAKVNANRRRAIMRNHTAAHLLQAALRRVLGGHVEQAGQLVDEYKLRFDFTHFSAVPPEELNEVERIINATIMESLAVQSRELPIAQARELGATALFGEKYGDFVRVVSAGDFSLEFCGGTHVDTTAKLGLFKIVSESSAAAGIRRIEAVTGLSVMKILQDNQALLRETAQALKVGNFSELPSKAIQLGVELREKERLLESMNAKMAAASLNDLFAQAETAKGVKVISALFSGADASALRAMCDRVRDVTKDDVAVAAVFAGVVDGKGTLVASCSKQAQALGLKAGNLVRAVAQVTGGNGGGKADFAMAGAKDISKLDEAIAAVPRLIEEQI